MILENLKALLKITSIVFGLYLWFMLPPMFIAGALGRDFYESGSVFIFWIVATISFFLFVLPK